MHKVVVVSRDGSTKIMNGKWIVIATGTHPRKLEIVEAEFGITSDELFWMEQEPEKTLVVGKKANSDKKLGKTENNQKQTKKICVISSRWTFSNRKQILKQKTV